MDIQKTREIRNRIRPCIPAFTTGNVDDDSLSAALATLCELLAFRVMNSRGQLSDREAVELVRSANDHVSGAMGVYLQKHLPSAKILKMFRERPSLPPIVIPAPPPAAAKETVAELVKSSAEVADKLKEVMPLVEAALRWRLDPSSDAEGALAVEVDTLTGGPLSKRKENPQ